MRLPVSLILIAAALSLPARVHAQAEAPSPQLVDRIVAIVDEEPILLSDLEREIESARFEAQSMGRPLPSDAAKLRADMLDRLIEVKLLVAQAKVDGLVIGKEELEGEVMRSLQQLIDRFGTRAALDRELAANGMRYSDLEARNRELVRNRLYMMRMVQTYVRPKVEVRDDEVRAYYEENLDQLPRKPETVRLAHILVVPQPRPEVMDAVRVRLAAVQRALVGGRSFEDVAKEFSEGPNASRGGLVGRFGRGDLFSPVLEEAAWRLPLGQISEPINTELGVHILQVTDRNETELELRQIMIRVEIGEAERAEARARAREVVEKARAGQDFAELARIYSDDPASRETGGELGSFEVPRLSSQFATAIEGLEPGEHSGVIEGVQGFFVLKLLDRAAGDVYSFDEIETNVRGLLMDQKSEEELGRFVDRLRERFYIEIKA